MSPEQSESVAQNKEPVKQELDQFREIAKGATKTALLWSAALTIVWFTGLERVHDNVSETLQAIQLNNRDKQSYLENEEKKDFISDTELAFRIKVANPQNIKAIVDRLKTQKEKARKEKDEEKDEKKKEAKDERVRDLERNIEQLEERARGFSILLERQKARQGLRERRRQVIENQRTGIEGRLQELRDKKKGVSFDILGQKFEVLPLYAPVLWSLFLVGLVAYLFRARSQLLTICVRTLCTVQARRAPAAAHFRGLFSGAAWWLAPLPRFPRTDRECTRGHTGESRQEADEKPKQSQTAVDVSVDRAIPPTPEVVRAPDSPARNGIPATVVEVQASGQPTAEVPVPIDADQVSDALGWHSSSLAPSLTVTIALFLITSSQFRVIWLGLEMSKQLGNNQQRAFVIVCLLSTLLLTLFIIFEWFRLMVARSLQESSAAHSVSRQIIVLALILAAPLGLFLVARHRQAMTNHVRDLLERSLVPLAIALAIAFLAFWVYRGIALLIDRWRQAGKSVRGMTGRRQFLYGTVAALGVIALRQILARDTPRLSGNPRILRKKCRRKGQTAPGLRQGFYFNGKTNTVHYVSDNEVIVGLSSACSLLKTGRLKPFRQLTLPERKPSGRNLWLDSSESSSVESAEEQQSAGATGGESDSQGRVIARKRPDSRTKFAVRAYAKRDSHHARRASRKGFFTIGKFTSNAEETGDETTLASRLHLTSASRSFEEAALFILRGRDLGRHDVEEACKLLIYGVNHDLYLVKFAAQFPSFRLFDLLAGLSLRYERPDYTIELQRVINDFGLRPLFQTRLEKWENPDRSWHKRWSDLERPVRWGGKRGIILPPIHGTKR